MKILKYKEIENAEEFLNYLFIDSVLESTDFPENTFFDKLTIHKLLVEEYKTILSRLDLITLELLKNSSLNIELTNKVIMLFSIAALSVCILDENKFLLDNGFKKSNYEKEIKSILEELKLSGVGNGLVKTLSSIFELVTDMSKKVFKSTSIFDSLSAPNLLKSILMYIEKHKISLTDFDSNFGSLMDTISKLYLKTGKLDDFKNKLSTNTQKSNGNNVLSINEFNL